MPPPPPVLGGRRDDTSRLARHLPALFGPARRARWRRTVLRRTGAVMALAVAAHLLAAQLRPPPEGPPVVVAARSVAPGDVVGADDVRLEPRRTDQAPVRALTSTEAVVGRRSTVGLEAGEVLTAARVGSTGVLSELGPGRRALELPVTAVPSGLEVGSRVDLYRAGSTEPVLSDVVVLAVPRVPEDDMLGAAAASAVTVAVRAPEAGRAVVGQDPGAPGFVVAVRPTGSTDD